MILHVSIFQYKEIFPDNGWPTSVIKCVQKIDQVIHYLLNLVRFDFNIVLFSEVSFWIVTTFIRFSFHFF